MTKLSTSTGLKRASLYHRFPSGKEAMAEEALAATVRFVDDQVLAVLRGLGDPEEKLEAAASGIRRLYQDGSQACLINLFGSPSGSPETLKQGAQTLVSSLISAVSQVLVAAGLPEDEARRRGLKSVVDIQGALVLARVYADKAPFQAVMAGWVSDLLRPVADGRTQAVKPERADPEPRTSPPEIRPMQLPRGPATKLHGGPPPTASRDVRRAVAAHLSALKERGEA